MAIVRINAVENEKKRRVGEFYVVLDEDNIIRTMGIIKRVWGVALLKWTMVLLFAWKSLINLMAERGVTSDHNRFFLLSFYNNSDDEP